MEKYTELVGSADYPFCTCKFMFRQLPALGIDVGETRMNLPSGVNYIDRSGALWLRLTKLKSRLGDGK